MVVIDWLSTRFIIFIYVQILSHDISIQSNKSRRLLKGSKDRFANNQKGNKAEIPLNGKATSS